ncbi:MAG: hypothetical protein QXR26_07640 [Candidatus Caldarchaeum sp.]
MKRLRGPRNLGRAGLLNLSLIRLTFYLKPPQDSPAGRLKAELRIKAVFIGDDGGRIGPITFFTDLEYVMVREFRTFSITVLDYEGFNHVSNFSVSLVSRL